jgi:hypothetical protein
MDNQWQLTSLSITYNGYGTDKGRYTGHASFQNGEKMSLNFKLDADRCSKFIALLQEDIVSSAKDFSQLLVSSMPLRIEEGK